MNAPVLAPPRDAVTATPQALPPISAAEQERVAALVRQCVPLRHPAFGKLLRLLSIELSREVPTAAVTTGSRSRLLINPDFLAERCRTEEHLAMLVMHELYHVLLGHTRIYRRPTLAANWAFDCIINAQLCRLHPGPGFTSFFRSLAAPVRIDCRPRRPIGCCSCVRPHKVASMTSDRAWYSVAMSVPLRFKI